MLIDKIDKFGITYIDQAGVTRYVNFQECNENWLAYRKRTESLDEKRMQEIRIQDKTVGQRDVGKQCFIEFFTKPFTRFEFQGFTKRVEYVRVRDAVFANGWMLYDLS